ncbi:response regulator transcription factor [Kocuria sp.]|jgi:DNA-binding NarL/FixJ family response regulator|uniref:response regulator transcription factor n=1 Tax=Kocuria sp. TaxID=1871328 RepID=UPI0028116588|nr:response regulator transcription factor [Kocuria sp.]HST72464.1 response regulator transcription factor [Kocuria rosea]
MTTTVLVVDDESITREAVVEFVSSDPEIVVVGESADGRVAIGQTRALSPDVVLMDMQMPVMDGVEATRIIRREFPDTAVIALTTFSSERYVVPVLRAGASGYLLKDARPQEIIAAIRTVRDGGSILSPAVTRHVVAGIAQSVPAQPVPDPELTAALTEKEIEVIQLLAQGMSNREMAEALFVTESTIKARFGKVTEKLGVRDRVQVLVKATERGLVRIRVS